MGAQNNPHAPRLAESLRPDRHRRSLGRILGPREALCRIRPLRHRENKRQDGKSFSVLLPPPNVTGNLHMGHMFEHTESDILVRWHRMCGDRVLWVPGTDHAGIATQMLVERQIVSEGTTREKMGREAFVERVWEWRRHYGGAILGQMKRLGASVDWDREYFTMDERLSVAVREAFVQLYEQGLIYRGAYIVNWCPRCQTAISDLEVVYDEHKGHLWEIRYPVLDEGGKETRRVPDRSHHPPRNHAGRCGRGDSSRR